MAADFVWAAEYDKPAAKYVGLACLLLVLVLAWLALVRCGPHWQSWLWLIALVAPILTIMYCFWYTRFFFMSAAPVWLCCAMTALMVLRTVLFVYVAYPARCWSCGYCIRGLPAPRCPECGARLTGSRPFRRLQWRWLRSAEESS